MFCGASALALMAAAAPALAQEAAAGGEVDAIIVTGTRSVERTVTSSLAPIDVLPATELMRSGRTSPRDLISTLVPSATTSQSGAGASFAVKTVSLRGLNADQVLVLVNGKRRHNTAILFVNGTTQNGQSPPDLDMIPGSAIERVEVLRDGASAQYGSDALAGVINLIFKNRASGGSVTVLGGKTVRRRRGERPVLQQRRPAARRGRQPEPDRWTCAPPTMSTGASPTRASSSRWSPGGPTARESHGQPLHQPPRQPPPSSCYSFGYDARLPVMAVRPSSTPSAPSPAATPTPG